MLGWTRINNLLLSETFWTCTNLTNKIFKLLTFLEKWFPQQDFTSTHSAAPSRENLPTKKNRREKYRTENSRENSVKPICFLTGNCTFQLGTSDVDSRFLIGVSRWLKSRFSVIKMPFSCAENIFTNRSFVYFTVTLCLKFNFVQTLKYVSFLKK